MRIGDQSTFAIEYELINQVDTFTYCRFRFWIDGHDIGDWNEVCVLGVLLHSASIFMRYKGNRSVKIPAGTSAEDVWDYIASTCLSDDPVLMHLAIEQHLRQKHFLHELADETVASHYLVLVVDDGDYQRLIWRSRAAKSLLFDKRVASGTVDKVVAKFISLNENNLQSP
jgi:Immunity protein 42